MTTITITIETTDVTADGRPELDWGKLRELVGMYTPAAANLPVRHPFSSDAIVGDTAWGTLTITQKLSDGDIVRDALKYNTALIVDTDPGIVVLAGRELAEEWENRSLDESFVIVGKTKNLEGSPAARAIEIAATQWTSDQYPGFVFSDYLKGQVAVIRAFEDQIFPDSVDAKYRDDAISALIRARVAYNERLAQVEVEQAVGPGAVHTAELGRTERVYLTEEARDAAEANS